MSVEQNPKPSANGSANGFAGDQSRVRSHGAVVSPAAHGKFPWHYPVLLLLVAVAVAAFVFWRHMQLRTALDQNTEDMAVPSVITVRPKLEKAQVPLVLPGRVQAFMESAIYARVNGYLKRWLVDIGAQVKEGQLLAEIDTPEIDQQLNQARAVLAQAQADVNLAQTSADRWSKLLKDNAVSQQEADEKTSDLEVKKANLSAAQADLKRLQDLQSFQKVYAPFDGVITARKTDVGNLINAGAGSSAQELFRIQQTGTLRVFVNVPEAYSGSVLADASASVEMAATPGKSVEGKLARNSGAIDPVSNTLLVEVDVANPDGKYLPGGYAQVRFDVAQGNPPLLIPANTLIFRSKGAQVGVVDPATNKVRMAKINIGRDFGDKLEVVSGLSETDAVIMNPSDSLTEGSTVHAEAKPENGAQDNHGR